MNRRISTRFARLTVAGAAALVTMGLVAGCGDDRPDPRAASALSISDQWVKGAPDGMTAAFGVLTNSGDTDIRIVSASSPAAGRMELHEVVPTDTGAMVMRPKSGGFVVPAKGTATLSPGGDHLMLLDLPAAVTPGQEIGFELTASDGSTMDFDAQVRDFPGAEENYQPGHGSGA
ncbi:copper chaperone PCu(A)C [Gordonia soli]|uniref:Copper chaperone PCu(A)C n=1 Tax=Gordonia soli NBRC 108243 TaxID=1223545 RepID=M0QGG4_9ACTN|nr:copper chaperone PCu(A)C [Gordonia soli]GAC67366.1 hypothetical protein GS4_07_01150 [Gordonia soli NBRC 108243]